MAPYGVWALAIGGFTLACALLVPSTRAQFDFMAGGTIVGHVIDRSYLPILIAQNGTSVLPALLAYFVAYVAAYAAYERMLHEPNLRAALTVFCIGAGCAVALPLFFTSDPYAYALYALESGPLDVNPYVSHANELSGHPWGSALLAIFPASHALVRVCNYGPAFALLYGGLATVLRNVPLLAFLLAERVLGALAVFAAALGLAVAAPDEPFAERVRRGMSFALHPLVLFEFVAFAHGDVLMFAALGLAYASFRRNRFWLAGGSCGLAVDVRLIALVALAALALASWRRGSAAFGRAMLGATLALASLAVISLLRFGTFSLGGPPVYNQYSAPFLALASLAHVARPEATGFVLEAIAGACVVAILLYHAARSGALRALVWLPLGTLVAAPSMYAHYATWFVTLRGITRDRRAIRVARTVSLVAPLTYIVHVDPFPAPGISPAAQLAVLAAVWLPVVVALSIPVGGLGRREA